MHCNIQQFKAWGFFLQWPFSVLCYLSKVLVHLFSPCVRIRLGNPKAAAHVAVGLPSVLDTVEQ